MSVGVFVDFLEEIFILEIEEDGGFFDFASVEDAFDYLFFAERLVGLVEDLVNDIGDCTFDVAPGIKGINAAADKNETFVFDEFVMDGLDGDIATFEVGVFDGFGDVGEVHGLLVIFEYDEDFVADVARVDAGPFAESPEIIEGGKVFRDAGEGGDVAGVFVVEFGVELFNSERFFVIADGLDDFIDFGFDGFDVTIFANADGGVVFVGFFNEGEVARNASKED